MKPNKFNLEVTGTTAVCPIGEVVGGQNAKAGAIPVLSCEGACIRGEIARLAANRVAQEPGYRRGCHGELFAVPDSAMSRWVRQASEVVVIDGCHLKCHARIVENLSAARIRGFDALARYRKYSDLFDIDAVPEAERKAVAGDVARWVLERLKQATGAGETSDTSCCTPRPSGGGGGCSAGEIKVTGFPWQTTK